MAELRTLSTIITVLLVQLLMLNNNEASYLCQNLKLQNCTKYECTSSFFSFECPKPTNIQWLSVSPLTIKVKINEEAKLECSRQDAISYDWLQGIDVGPVIWFEIKFCPLPEKTLHDFLSDLNVTGVKKIRIEAGLRNFKLAHQYFKNLENVTHLLLPSNQLSELPIDLLQNMNYLTNLDLHNNNLTISNNELAGLVNLKKLELGDNNIHQLHPGSFESLRKLEFLNLWGNYMKNLTKEMFVGLENLSSLDVSVNQIINISADTFNDLKNLRILSLLKNNFTFLPENIFSAAQKLEVVKLQNNERLSKIPKKLFADLPMLQDINLSRCNLSSIPDDILWGSHNLIKVDLSGNYLTTLPEMLFRDTKSLRELDISYNQIATLNGLTFSSLKEMEILHIHKNKMTSINEELFQGLNELKTLRISHNNIEHIDVNAFKKLKNLNRLVMSYNKITFENDVRFGTPYSPLSHCENLQILDLSHNNIHTIFDDWMFSLMKLRKLDLSYNNLTYLDAQSLQFLSSQIDVNLQYNQIATLDLSYLELINSQNPASSQVSVVNLTGNDLNCNCRIYDLLRYREKKMQPMIYKQKKLILDTITCKNPPNLNGYPISKLNSQTFTCEWQSKQKCPDQCQCFQWMSVKHLVVNCTRAGLTKIPEEIKNPQFANKLLIDLILDSNYLHFLPLEQSLRETNVTTLSLSHNYISWIDDSALPSKLKELKLDNNNMSHINSSLLEFFTNRTNLTLHNNPWSCDCESLDFLGFLQNSYKQVATINNVTCFDGRILSLLIAEEICPLDRTVIIVASTTIAIIGIMIGLLAALYFRYQNEVKVWLYAHNVCLWLVTEDELDKDKIYDAFISYSHQDENFVTTKLLPELENGSPPFKICVHYRDWIVGEFITKQITRSVDDSKRTIVVLSKNFIKSEWGRLEFRAAHKQALTEKRARVIVVLYGDLGPLDDLDSELRSYLSTNTYVKWGDPWFWSKLRYALPHHRKTQLKTRQGSEKLELINSSAIIKSSTPPTDVSVNPLEVINNFSSKQCKIFNELNGYTNNSYIGNTCESSVKSSECA